MRRVPAVSTAATVRIRRSGADSRFRGEPGFRDEPDFRSRTDTSDTSPLGNGSGSLYNPGSYPVTGYASNGTETDDVVTTRRTPSPAQLEDVFDDPAHGDPGRDRMMVHILWEVLLLLATAGVAVLLYRGHRATVTGAGLRDLEVSAAILGFLALGAGLSLRAAVPNLALGPVAYASALFFAQHADRGLLTTAVVTGLLAVAAGAVLAVVVVGFHVPAWAASLGAALGLLVWIGQRTHAVKMTSTYAPTRHSVYWLGAFAVLAVVGGLLGMSKAVRRAVGRFRPVADPARRRGAGAGVLAAVALIGSSALASPRGLAGHRGDEVRRRDRPQGGAARVRRRRDRDRAAGHPPGGGVRAAALGDRPQRLDERTGGRDAARQLGRGDRLVVVGARRLDHGRYRERGPVGHREPVGQPLNVSGPAAAAR